MARIRPLAVPLEETGVVLLPERMSPPFDWREIFGRDGPVELEIGSGKGRYLLEASALRPASNFLGVERAGKWFHCCVERCLRAGRSNIRLIRADAFDLLARWVPAASLSAVHIYFPDPWPKKRHAKRRLLQSSLYPLIERSLSPGASFFIASDVEGYFVEAAESIPLTAAFQRVEWDGDAPDRLPTNYALKYLREGRTLHYAKFRREGGAHG